MGTKFKNYVILGASIFFYSWGAPKFIFVILASTIIDFYIVKKLHLSSKATERKFLLVVSIFINLGLLAYFKYANFFVENLNAGLESLGFTQLGWTSVALPIGISFYTFQTLTYSVDVYRKVHAPLEKVTDYLVYIMSFPQMIAGPIIRFNAIADQITHRKEISDDKLIGFYRFSIGLAKKVLIANVMAEQAEREQRIRDNCDIAQENRRILTSAPRVQDVDEQGNAYFLEPNAITAKLAQAEDQVRKYCP